MQSLFATEFVLHVNQLLGDVWDEDADGQTQCSMIDDVTGLQ